MLEYSEVIKFTMCYYVLMYVYKLSNFFLVLKSCNEMLLILISLRGNLTNR